VVFEEIVYGGLSHPFWQHIETIASESTSRGVEMVAVLNNTFDYKLSLHHAILGTNGVVELHEMPRVEEAPAENDTITKAADFLELEDFENMDYTEKQELSVPHLHNTWTLVRSRGADRFENVIDITVVTSGAEVKYYNATVHNVENLMDDGLISPVAVVLALLASCILCMFVIYAVVWCVYKRTGKVPCFKYQGKEDDQARLNLGIPSSSMNP
jgi:hypothetical protein